MAKQRIGGTFAPPLTDELLTSYQALINEVPAKTQLREALDECLACVRKWWELPESGGSSRPHGSGKGTIVDLDTQCQEQLWDLIPWEEEIETIAGLFDKLDPIKEKTLRNAAFHLLWHVKELNLDREPITKDKV